ncbi:LPXTG-motif cell wall anchor domain-containing protein [Sinosporangium album]|uniref:LPXTG-motif cell wall anchor domain-containing protein n=1 Tax=Sinosporangium album TaxID=504805 RepID=A0A1G7V7X7_9ACTN|nr:DUF3618 domain-containing protein [Sinosporangium album]SDG55844.1 LPXTG-motif cell wall anchor domain-containing protein [Sinosporangium album]
MAETDPEELERRIERTRTELARTVDEIAERVHPRRVAERGVAKAKANAEHFVSTAADLIGLGARDATPDRQADDGEALWEDDRPALAPALVAVGAVLVVGAVVMLWRRRRRR